jgi:hypothetical protein
LKLIEREKESETEQERENAEREREWKRKTANRKKINRAEYEIRDTKIRKG